MVLCNVRHKHERNQKLKCCESVCSKFRQIDLVCIFKKYTNTIFDEFWFHDFFSVCDIVSKVFFLKQHVPQWISPFLSTSIYDLVLLDVCHFHQHFQGFWKFIEILVLTSWSLHPRIFESGKYCKNFGICRRFHRKKFGEKKSCKILNLWTLNFLHFANYLNQF